MFPQTGFGQPMAPQMQSDPNFADWLCQEVGRQLASNPNIRPEVKQGFVEILNFRANPNFIGNADRMCQFVVQRLGQMGVQPNGASPQHYQQAVSDYIQSRIGAVTNLVNQQMQQRQMQTAPFMQPGFQSGFMGQGGMAQMGGAWGGMGQPQQQQGWGNYPAQPQNQGWGAAPPSGMQPGNVSYDPLPDIGEPVNTAPMPPVPPAQPTNVVSDTAWDAPAPASNPADVFDTPNLSTTTIPGQTPKIDPNVAPRLNYKREEIDSDLADHIDSDLLEISEDVRHVAHLGEIKAQTSVLKMRQRMNDLDQALREATEALPDDFREGEYLHVVQFDQLHSLQIPTNEYSGLIAKVRMVFEEKKDWRALMSVLDHTTHIYTKRVDRFITQQINRSLLRFFRCEDDLASRIRIQNLDDLTDLMGGKFGAPQKNIPDWKAHLDRIMHQIIETFFLKVDIMLPSDADLSDVVRCEENRMIVDGISKYSLFQADEEGKKRYLDAVFNAMTIIRTRREAIVTNMLGKSQCEQEDLNSAVPATNNEKMFWTAYDLTTRAHKCADIDCVYIFKGDSWDLAPGSLRGAKLASYPNVTTPEGVGSATRVHLMTHHLFYGDKAI